MKKLMFLCLVWLFCCFLIAGTATAEEVSNYELDERIKKLEEKMGEGDSQEWTNRITISGAVEAEAGFTITDYLDSATDDVDESDIVLSTVELGVDAEIHKHVSGHILFLYEEDENDDNIAIDEGFITIYGKDIVPLYLNAGKLYLPFGNFESHMITDPVTLDLGETSQSAVQVGFANDWIDASVAIYNGDVDESGEDNDIGSYAAGVQFSFPEDTVANVGLSAGISYISNIADTDGMEGLVEPTPPDDTLEIKDNVAGLGAFISLFFMEKVFLEAEYISAMDKFNAGELTYNPTQEVEPSAWNLELAFAPTDNLEVAARYAQTDDFIGGIDDEVLPETQYGLTVAYGVFDSTTLALEYLKDEYENDDEVTTVTAQLAIEF